MHTLTCKGPFLYIAREELVLLFFEPAYFSPESECTTRLQGWPDREVKDAAYVTRDAAQTPDTKVRRRMSEMPDTDARSTGAGWQRGHVWVPL